MAITQDYVSVVGVEGNDYKGATFTDGSFANATLTLTKAGAFADTSVGHWLYLDDNGSGEVTTGYYRVTGIAGAPNSVVLHADIRSGVNDPVDVVCTQHDGTALLPWRSLQGAFDLLTRNAADGNQVNLKAGAANVNDAALDLNEVIAGSALVGAAPLIVRGYTAAANDGGIGEIDCGGATMWADTTYDYVVLADLEIHTFGDNNGIYLDNTCSLIRCEIHKGASAPAAKRLIRLSSVSRVVGCYVHDIGTGIGYAVDFGTATQCVAYANYIALGATSEGYGIYGGAAYGNIVVCANTAAYGIYPLDDASGNTAYNSAAGTNWGIGVLSGSVIRMRMNNIVEGWSGVGGRGLNINNAGFVGYNAFYNNTAAYGVSDQIFLDLTANDINLAASPFTNAANGDFSLTDAGKTALRGVGWPAAYLGAHANTDGHITPGAVQYGEAEAGGGMLASNKRGNKL